MDTDISVYKQAFESSIDAIICGDETGVITLWNPAAEKMFGYSKKEVLRQPISLLMPEKFRSAHNAGMSNFVRTGKAAISGKVIEVAGLRKDGTTFPLELSISATKNNDLMFTAVLRDITMLKKIEGELAVSNKKLAFESDQKGRRAAELVVANKKLAFENEQKGKRAAELAVANKKLAFENKQKGTRSAELVTVNQELKSALTEIEALLIGADKNSEIYLQSLTNTIKALGSTVEKRDPYTAGHQNRVAQLSKAIAKKMGLSKDRVKGIELGAIIHDIGKIYVPAEILNRPGKLSKAEFEMIQSHSQVGFDIIKGLKFPWPIADMVLSHHERLDGSGYPNGLKGDEICLEAQILAVADVVEAVSSHRPYRPAKSIQEGLNIINNGRGTHYNPEIVDICIKLIKNEGFEFS